MLAKKNSRLKKNSSSSQLTSSQSGIETPESDGDSASLSSESVGSGSSGRVEMLAQAMAETQYSTEILDALRSYQVRLNL